MPSSDPSFACADSASQTELSGDVSGTLFSLPEDFFLQFLSLISLVGGESQSDSMFTNTSLVFFNLRLCYWPGMM